MHCAARPQVDGTGGRQRSGKLTKSSSRKGQGSSRPADAYDDDTGKLRQLTWPHTWLHLHILHPPVCIPSRVPAFPAHNTLFETSGYTTSASDDHLHRHPTPQRAAYTTDRS